ncbi:hypothetical protein ACLOJK_016043 [Asimina triloba]
MMVFGEDFVSRLHCAVVLTSALGKGIVVVDFVSIPSIWSSIREWPRWLRPATVSLPDNVSLTGDVPNVNALVKRKRPLIYVYDLPPEFNSHLLEIALYESILASPHRTLNGDEADYFYVPVLDSCLITRADDAPHLSMQEHMGLRSSFTLDYYKKAYLHIVEHYPYWNLSSGRDHIWLFSWDEGACYAPKEIWNSMMLVHWGNTNSKHNHSTTAYWADNWDQIPLDRRGDHPCFDPDKDLVIPAWKHPDLKSLKSKLWARQKLAKEFGSIPDKDGKLGRQYAENVIVTSKRSYSYYEQLANSTFCGVLPGDGWSGRMEDCILRGCIPVVIQDGIFLPYENFLNYDSFVVRIREDEIPNLLQILQQFNETEVEFMLENVRKIWQRFLYRDSVLLEADRQKSSSGQVYDWGIEFSKLGEDDVFSTFIQGVWTDGTIQFGYATADYVYSGTLLSDLVEFCARFVVRLTLPPFEWCANLVKLGLEYLNP